MELFDTQITFCYTRDLEKTARFYEKVLDLELVLDQGACRIYRTAPNCYLGFCRKAEAGQPTGVILTLVTDDVDGWFEHLTEAGVSFETEPSASAEYGIYHCFFRDPNGYLLEIQRFNDPGWAGER